MQPPPVVPKSGKERDETDANLRAERDKTDAEFAKVRVAAEGDADEVVEVARRRADETLRMARELADWHSMTAPGSTDQNQDLQRARIAEDGALADERAVADHRLESERGEHRRVLFGLVLEREATDDGLLVERARADRAVAVRDEFLAIVSHDLRTMLSNVSMSAALLAKHAAAQGDGGAVTSRHASTILRSAARMSRLVGDLVDVVSLEAGQLHLTMGAHDATEVARDAVEAFQAAFTAQGISLKSAVPAGPLRARFDVDRVLQVLANLLGNALKFTGPGGVVVLSLAATNASVRFAVTDSGVGIPAGQEAVIFERFRKLSPADRPGLGLGLYIAKCIVDAHGGSIAAKRVPEGGTAFEVILPAG
jgi:signal transduction histidine kinase